MVVHALNQSWEIEVVDVVARDNVRIFITNHLRHLFHNQIFSASIFVDAARTIDHIFNPNGCTENRVVGNARFQIVGQNSPWHLERFTFLHILKLDRNGAIDLIPANATVFDDAVIAFSILIVMFPLIDQKAINGKVHAHIIVQEHAIDKGNVARINHPTLLLQFTSKRWNIERLNRFNRPYRFLTQIGPFPNRTTNIHDFGTTTNYIDASLLFIGHRLIFATFSNTCDLKRWSQSGNKNTDGCTIFATTKQLDRCLWSILITVRMIPSTDDTKAARPCLHRNASGSTVLKPSLCPVGLKISKFAKNR